MDVADVAELSAKLDEARRRRVPPGEISTPVLRHGTMELRLFRPVDGDGQAPHDRDELYLVASGTAVLLRGGGRSPWEEASPLEEPLERIPMGAGDAAVVPAGTIHHFVDVSPDFATWTVFWGPEGGAPA